MIHLYEVSIIVKFRNRKWNSCYQRLGEENGSDFFNGYRASVRDHENFLETDGGDAISTLRMYLMPLNCKLKNGQKGKFCVCLPQ